MNLNYRLILGSNSPRRKQLLLELGLDIEVVTQSIDEDYPKELENAEVPEFLARKKASAFELKNDELVITADTIVIENDEILGKPKSEKEAIKVLNRLSSKTHTVITGVCLKTNKELISFKEITEVTFTELANTEVEYYVNTFHPMDKAGAYGIQEWIGMIGIKSIQGDYYNVVGLPLNSLWRELKKFMK